jgi:uncharacterized protein (DUF169 family)
MAASISKTPRTADPKKIQKGKTKQFRTLCKMIHMSRVIQMIVLQDSE